LTISKRNDRVGNNLADILFGTVFGVVLTVIDSTLQGDFGTFFEIIGQIFSLFAPYNDVVKSGDILPLIAPLDGMVGGYTKTANRTAGGSVTKFGITSDVAGDDGKIDTKWHRFFLNC